MHWKQILQIIAGLLIAIGSLLSASEGSGTWQWVSIAVAGVAFVLVGIAIVGFLRNSRTP
jgi:hypothetical protein